MTFDFVIPVFTDLAGDMWLSSAKTSDRRSAWQAPQRISELEFLSGLGREIEDAGATVAYLAATPRVVATLGRRFSNVFDLYDGLVRGRPVPADERWQLERRFGITSLSSFVYPERMYDWANGERDLIPRAVHVLEWLERFVASHRVGTFVNHVGAEVVRRSIGVIAARHCIPNLIFDFAAVPGHFILADDEQGVRLPYRPGAASPEDREWARAYVRQMVEAKRPWSSASPLGFGRSNLRGALNAIRHSRVQKDVSIGHLVEERFRRVVRRAVGSALWQPAIDGERYFFFPLHLPNDSTLTVRAPQYQRQEELVEYLSERALPAGTKLYVKPHIGARDSFRVDMLAHIRKMPNVRLIAPATNPHELIRRALGSIVINSTAGFESVLHGKPTIVLGSPWYTGQGLTIDVDKPALIPAAIERAITFVPSMDRLLDFLGQYRHLVHRGVFGLDEPENIASVASVLLRYRRPTTATVAPPSAP